MAQQTARRKHAIIPATTLTRTIVNREVESIETDPPSRGDAESNADGSDGPLLDVVGEGEVEDCDPEGGGYC